MIKFVLLVFLFSIVIAVKLIMGPYYVEPGAILYNEPENEYVHYKFQVNKKGRGVKQIDAKFEVLKKIQDLQISGTLFKKKGTNAEDYYQVNPRTSQKSLCSESWPEFKNCFSGAFDSEDCSLSPGKYKLTNYSLEAELRHYVGDKTFYGEFKGIIYLTDPTIPKDVIVFEFTYEVKPLSGTPRSG